MLAVAAISAEASAGGVTRESAANPKVVSSAQAAQAWFWSRDHVQRTLRRNGITWRDGHDRVQVAKCSGLGKWIVSRGVPMFRDFHCYIDSHERPVYKIIFHVVGERKYRFIYARQQTKVKWWWPAQLAADSLVTGGIRWSTGLQTIAGSSCSAFGPSARINGRIYYELFYCTVRPTRGASYGVVLDVTDRETTHITFVTYTDELPATPVVRTPVPSSNTSNQQLVNHLLINQLSLQMVQNGIRHQNRIAWGNDYAPHVNDFILGSVGCASDPFVNTPYRSYGSC